MENFNTGLLYAGMGILVVFAVLIILMFVIMAMKLFAKDETAPKAAPTPVQAPASTAAAIDTNETIAVISATVAAMSGDDPNKRLRVKSIKDQSGNVIWSK
ncbi:MAG: OadG family protein [Clostridia bacterium]|nr:OadG family protein [Clostridia bacterium]